MNKVKIFLIISIIGIFTLVIIAQTQPPITQGKISSIEIYEDRTVFTLEKINETKFILFDKIKLTQGQFIKVYGTQEIYQNQKQVLVDKIKCSK